MLIFVAVIVLAALVIYLQQQREGMTEISDAGGARAAAKRRRKALKKPKKCKGKKCKRKKCKGKKCRTRAPTPAAADPEPLPADDPEPLPADPETLPADPVPVPSGTSLPAAGVLTVDRIFSPYYETWRNEIDLNRAPSRNFTFAFLLSDGKGNLAWNGNQPIDSINDKIASARAKGGRLILSFGGAAGKELALDVASVGDLATKYAQVATSTGSTWLDFDIEGSALGNMDANTRRHKAIARVQSKSPNMYVSFTLPVMPTGLMPEALAMLSDAKKHGVNVGCVNLMTMDYGDAFAGDMGAYAIEAAKSTHAQLATLGMVSTKVGITPMIGKNDNGPNPFSIKNAQAVVDFANATPWVGLLAFWALGRDNGSKTSLDVSSMITQTEWEFTNTFSKYNTTT